MGSSAGPSEIVAVLVPVLRLIIETVSSRRLATKTNAPSGLDATAPGRRPTTIRRGACSSRGVIAISSTPDKATIKSPPLVNATGPGSPAA